MSSGVIGFIAQESKINHRSDCLKIVLNTMVRFFHCQVQLAVQTAFHPPPACVPQSAAVLAPLPRPAAVHACKWSKLASGRLLAKGPALGAWR